MAACRATFPHLPLRPRPLAFPKEEEKKRRNGVAFMELTFLKLVGSRSTLERERESVGLGVGGRGEREREAEAKKIEATKRVWWTGVMAVLELRYQSPNPSSPRPLGNPLAAPRPLRSTPFHSIPPLLHSETILETRRTVAPLRPPPPPRLPCSQGWPSPLVKHGVSGNAAAQALSPLPSRTTLSLFPSMYMHGTHTLATGVFLPAAS